MDKEDIKKKIEERANFLDEHLVDEETVDELKKAHSVENTTDFKSDSGIHQRSGSVSSEDKLVTFLYILMRDHLPLGQVEEAVKNSETFTGTYFSNGWLAEYAKDITRRLK